MQGCSNYVLMTVLSHLVLTCIIKVVDCSGHHVMLDVNDSETLWGGVLGYDLTSNCTFSLLLCSVVGFPGLTKTLLFLVFPTIFLLFFKP